MNENKKPALPEEEYCFACGKKNPVGLHLDFQIEIQLEWITVFGIGQLVKRKEDNLIGTHT